MNAHPHRMLGRYAHALIAPGLRRVPAGLQRRGMSADQVTLAGFALGLAAAAAIALVQPFLGRALLLTIRLADGLDVAQAWLAQPTDRGAFLDIALDSSDG